MIWKEVLGKPIILDSFYLILLTDNNCLELVDKYICILTGTNPQSTTFSTKVFIRLIKGTQFK